MWTQGLTIVSRDKQICSAVLLNMLTLPPPPEFYVSPRELIFYPCPALLPSIKELTFLTEVFMKNDSLVMSTVQCSSRTTPFALMICTVLQGCKISGNHPSSCRYLMVKSIWGKSKLMQKILYCNVDNLQKTYILCMLIRI